ncbi:MAG: hypothetical protein OXE92_10860 [Bacteroidetes bacterium]|nr:hypothetical protein [Bacteroidota bacterium]MCY4206211.1 hypothetical protein [Bacteroidota bacterium]
MPCPVGSSTVLRLGSLSGIYVVGGRVKTDPYDCRRAEIYATASALEGNTANHARKIRIDPPR